MRPGASTEAILAAEKAMGLKLPADLKASYRIHDGAVDELERRSEKVSPQVQAARKQCEADAKLNAATGGDNIQISPKPNSPRRRRK